MSGGGLAKWRPARVETHLSICGGFENSKSFVLQTKRMNVNGQQVTVATVRKDFEWFYKICKSGKAARRDDMKRVKVLDDLTKLAMSQLE